MITDIKSVGRHDKWPGKGRIMTGRGSLTGLKHKDGSNFSDVEYFELLGRIAEKMDKENPGYPSMPTNYGNFDRDVVALAKEVVKGLDAGKSDREMRNFLSACIQY